MPSISFKVTDAQKAELEAFAGKNLSDYLRRIVFGRLEQDQTLDLVLQRLARIEEKNASSPPQSSPSGTSGETPNLPPEVVGWLLEMLLMLRVVMPEKSRQFAQAEVKRLGLPVFESAQ